MSTIGQLIAKLAAAGTPPELLAEVADIGCQLEALQRDAERLQSRRATDRDRKKRWHTRQGNVPEREVTLPHVPAPLKERKEPKERNTPQDPEGLRPSPSATPPRADLERDFYNRGKQVLGKNAGGLLTGLLKAKQQDIALARSTLELAATKADPREFVAAACKTAWHMNGHAQPMPRPGSREDRAERTSNAIRDLDEYIHRCADERRAGSRADQEATLLLPFAKPA